VSYEASGHRILTRAYCGSDPAGTLSCWERVADFRHAKKLLCRGNDLYLYERKVRFSTTRASPSRSAMSCARRGTGGVRKPAFEIEFIRKRNFRKEAASRRCVQAGRKQPGLVQILGHGKPLLAYKPWERQASGRTYLDPMTASGCITYFTSSRGNGPVLCGVPTWLPLPPANLFNGQTTGWLPGCAKTKDRFHPCGITLFDL